MIDTHSMNGDAPDTFRAAGSGLDRFAALPMARHHEAAKTWRCPVAEGTSDVEPCTERPDGWPTISLVEGIDGPCPYAGRTPEPPCRPLLAIRSARRRDDQNAVTEWALKAGVPRSLAAITFETAGDRAAIRAARQFLTSGLRAVTFCGAAGIGKTYAAVCVLKHLRRCSATACEGAFIRADDAAAVFLMGTLEERATMWDRLRTTLLLVLDDVSVGSLTASPQLAVAWRSVFGTREGERRPTILTSNLDESALRAVFDSNEGVARRLLSADWATIIPVAAPESV